MLNYNTIKLTLRSTDINVRRIYTLIVKYDQRKYIYIYIYNTIQSNDVNDRLTSLSII